MSFVVELSGIKIGVLSESEYIKRKCAPYICNGAPEFSVCVSREEIENEAKLVPGFPDDYYEYSCLYRQICYKMPEYDRMLFHSAVIDAGGRGYAFAAKSGVGKTTHIKLWYEHFDDVSIINGDKPIIAMKNDGFYACGTPWCGKEGYNINREIKLNAIVFLERGENNKITPLSPKRAADRVFKQIIIPKNAALAAKTLEFTDKLLKSVPIFELYCNMYSDAAKTARNALDLI